MFNKIIITVLLVGAMVVPLTAPAQDDLRTLFTTQKERELIDANRYRNEPQPTLKPQMQATPSTDSENTVTREEKLLSILLSGFTLTQSGQNVAWVNGKPYENGSKLEDGSTLIISKKNKRKVQLKTPDGKYHTLSAGKYIDISYLKPLDEG